MVSRTNTDQLRRQQVAPKPPPPAKPTKATERTAKALSALAGRQAGQAKRTQSAFEAPAAKAAGPVEKYTPGKGIGGGEPAVNYNGTKQTGIEGSAGNSSISIHNTPGGKSFDPMTQPGVALTSQQAKALGVKSGDKVTVHDRLTGKDHTATFYDGAGSKRANPLQHMEMSPALAEQAGLNIKRNGKYIDAVQGSEQMRGRFEIRPYQP